MGSEVPAVDMDHVHIGRAARMASARLALRGVITSLQHLQDVTCGEYVCLRMQVDDIVAALDRLPMRPADNEAQHDG